MADLLRTGIGFDVHRFEEGRQLLLGGVEFEGAGLSGHSDGDVVCHALADALLGAAGLGDVGRHFPDDDPAVAGMAGLDLLGRTIELLRSERFVASSCDVSVIAEQPAIAPRSDEMRSAMAEVLGVASGRVSVKATRPEGLGLSGDGIGCLAVAVVSGPG